MARSKAEDVAVPVIPIEDQIREYSKGLKRNPNVRANHLTMLALCGLKYLVLKTESDSLRLAALKTIIDLPMVQARMGNLARAVGHLHQHVHVDATSQALVEKLTHALTNGNTQGALDLLLPTKSIDIVPNSLETNPNP